MSVSGSNFSSTSIIQGVGQSESTGIATINRRRSFIPAPPTISRIDLMFRPCLPISSPMSSGWTRMAKVPPSGAKTVSIVTSSGRSTIARTILRIRWPTETSLKSDMRDTLRSYGREPCLAPCSSSNCQEHSSYMHTRPSPFRVIPGAILDRCCRPQHFGRYLHPRDYPQTIFATLVAKRTAFRHYLYGVI